MLSNLLPPLSFFIGFVGGVAATLAFQWAQGRWDK